MDLKEDYQLYFPQYEAQYGISSFNHDYKNTYYEDFYSKLSMLKGDYGEILKARDAYLNRKQTKDNAELRKHGKLLLTTSQKEELKQRAIEKRGKGNDYDTALLMDANEIFKMKGLK